jgi:hypothetical protein
MEVHMSWTNGSKDGYEKGFKDGVEGKPSNPISSLTDLITHTTRPESYSDTHRQGYDQGWEHGHRKKNGI